MELSTLQDETEDGVTIKFKDGEISSTGSARRNFLSIEQWTDAFNVFASVYRLKYPEQAEQLASYMNIIRKISNEGGAWYFYDTNFRKIRSAANFAWDQIHSEIYVTALSRKQNTQPRFRSGRDLSGQDRSRGSYPYTCNKFNKGSHCAGCDYRHICKQCGGKHLDALIVKTNSAVVQPVISRTISLGPKPPEYPNLPTQVKWLPLSEYLDGYDLDAKQFILDGFKFGFSLNFSGVRCSQDSHNLTTAKDNPEIVRQKLLNELTTGRIAGPFD